MICVSTSRFWTLMCMSGFVRMTRHTGRIGDVEYFVEVAPEDEEGFIEARIEETARSLDLRGLRVRRYWHHRLRGAMLTFIVYTLGGLALWLLWSKSR